MVPCARKLKEGRPPRRSFDGIRFDLLEALNEKRTTVNELSKKTKINWKTVDNHLVYLCGRGWAEKVFDSPTIKIFEITETGKDRLDLLNLRKERDKPLMQKVSGITSHVKEISTEKLLAAEALR